MSDNRFSSGNPSGQDRFGYFGAAGEPSGGGSSAFGAGPAAPAANPFGTAPAPQTPFGTPMEGFSQPPVRSSGSKAKPIATVLVVLALLGAGWFGYHVYERSRPVVLPTTLDGLPVSSQPAVRQAVTSSQSELKQQYPNVQMQMQAYGADNTRILIVAAGRGRTNVADDLSTFGNNIGATSQVGTSTCATAPTSHVTVCERSDGDLTVMVASVTAGSAADESAVAALVDQVWVQL